MKDFKNFKGKHPLRFSESPVCEQTTIADTKTGDVFLREGAICMRVQDRVGPAAPPYPCAAIINLQSAAVWYADASDQVYVVDATLVVSKTYKPEGA